MCAQYLSADSPWIVAHRGGLRDAPENTLAAFDAALRYPIDGIEFDVQMTRDGVLVLHHDRTLRRIRGRYQRISDLSYDTLATLDWGSWFGPEYANQRIVTLKSALSRYAARTRLMVEVKIFPRDKHHGRYRDIAAAVVRTLRENVPEDRLADTFVLSFDRDVLDVIHAQDERWRCVLNTVTPLRILEEHNGDPGYLAAYCAPVGRITRDIADRIHDQGRRLMTWACNTSRQIERARSARCDVIMSDRPAWIAHFVAEHAKRGAP